VITSIITFLSTRIVSVVITTVVVVAAVPTLIVAIHGNTITITTGPVASATRTGDDQERARIVVEVKSAGDSVIVKLNNEEASCDSQIWLPLKSKRTLAPGCCAAKSLAIALKTPCSEAAAKTVSDAGRTSAMACGPIKSRA